MVPTCFLILSCFDSGTALFALANHFGEVPQADGFHNCLFSLLFAVAVTVSRVSRLGFTKFDKTHHFFKKSFEDPLYPNSLRRFSRNRRSPVPIA
jgi:hypothetical protein